MIKEHDRIVLTNDLSKDGLKAGDVGTVIHIYPKGAAFEVEFMALEGKTIAVATVLVSQLRSVTDMDITHARPIKIAV